MARVAKDDSSLAAFGEYIRAQRRLARISQRNLAKATGVSDSYLSQVERGLYRPSAQVAKALAEAFGLSPQTLYTQLGLLDEESVAPSGVEQAIREDSRLGPEQKEALTLMYRTLVDQVGGSKGDHA
jgi:transcriptional regulator with XRE-family HTH domain